MGVSDRARAATETHLLLRVDVFVEAVEGVNVKLHELPEQVEVALQNISGRTAAVDDAEQDVLRVCERVSE